MRARALLLATALALGCGDDGAGATVEDAAGAGEDAAGDDGAAPDAPTGADAASEDGPDRGDGGASDGAAAGDGAGGGDAVAGRCPADMREVAGACMDLYEAPNVPGQLPLVMYTMDESEAWCGARGKRLCWEDEWLAACAGPQGYRYPYGNTRMPGVCNDNKVWRVYSQTLLNGWPARASAPDVATLEELYMRAAAVSQSGAAAANHVRSLYQGSAAGASPGCVGAAGVGDTHGNVEEWTRRRAPSGPQFKGNLKGRYWAEARTCQGNVTTHANGFRFYEIGFRCCRDLP